MGQNENTEVTLNNAQVLYVRYFTAILMDLVVLNLFVEYWDAVKIESFSISLLAAILLQLMLKVSIALEHHVGSYVQDRAGKHAGKWRLLSAWAILFVSKLVILEALTLVFGDEVQFIGAYHGVVPFILVVITMLVAEAIMKVIYVKLAGKPEAQPA